MANPGVNDVGVNIKRTLLKADGSTPNFDDNTSKSVTIIKPDGTSVSKTPTYTTPNIFSYLTASGDLNLSGRYRARIVVSGPGYTFSSEYKDFNVDP